MHSAMEEDVEQDHMEDEIDAVAAREACKAPPGRFCAEGEPACGEEIAYEAYDISGGIADVDVHPDKQQEIIDTVVHRRRKRTDYAEADEFGHARAVPKDISARCIDDFHKGVIS